MKWMKIKGFPNYILSEMGDIYSIKSDKIKNTYFVNGTKYVSLSNDGFSTNKSVAKLVLNYFQPSKTKINVHAWHKDLELENCANFNLERCNRSDRLRLLNEIRGKKRGIYPWKIGKNKFRVVLKTKDKKTKTIGYFKTRLFAEFRYIQAYKKEFGRLPY